jgi:RHS repeat-associated protein
MYADARVPLAMTKDGLNYYLSYDQVGSLRLVTHTFGNVVKEIDYDSFGNVLADSDPSFTVPFGFAGGLCDVDTGLVHFGARDYDPDTGMWTAKDPILFKGGDTDLYGYVDSVGKPLIGTNLFIYASNNPINRIDPAGLLDIGKAATGFLSITDGLTMIGTGSVAVVGTAVVTQNPALTAIIGGMMVPVFAGGAFDVYHGAQLFWEGLTEPSEGTQQGTRASSCK